jgi:hypothetical protein
VQRVGVDDLHLLGEERFRRKRKRLGDEGMVLLREQRSAASRNAFEGSPFFFRMMSAARRCPASQRLKGSSSCAIRCTRSDSLYG